MLVEVQGIITFLRQKMPHASSIIQFTPLEYRGEQPQRPCARRSRLFSDISELDRVIDLMLRQGLPNKRYSDSTVKTNPLLCCVYSSDMGSIAQQIGVNSFDKLVIAKNKIKILQL